MEKNRECTILVTSCYAYRDVLRNFEIFFRKYWSDCPFPVYLNIDRPVKKYAIDYDEVIISDHKENLLRMRDVTFKTPYVLMMQDDHFLFDQVDNEKILRCIQYARKYHCGNLRLLQDPKTAVVFSKTERLLEYKPGSAYRISARGGLWNTEYLNLFIHKFKDLWEMERYGKSFSSQIPMRVLCTRDRILPMIDAVHKGCYEEFACALLEANGIVPKRKQISSLSKAKESLKGAVLEINPALITDIQAKLNIGYKMKY